MLEIGSSLREARRRRGLGLAEVESATLIRRRYLEALEQEQFELLPTGSYRRSFLREYAEFLGLDGDTYTGEYDLRLASLEPEPPSAPPRLGSGLVRLLSELRVGRALALAAAVVVVGIAVWQLGGSGGTGVVNAPRPTTKTSPPAPARKHAHHPAATVQPSPRRPAPLLTLTAARGNCWLSVRIGSRAGHTLYEQTLQKGQTVRFGLRKRLWIRLGAPWNLDATIGGRPFRTALPTRTGDLLATSSGLRATP
jgi:cytoskeleton protein RodZ